MTEKISGKSVKWPKPDFEKKNLGNDPNQSSHIAQIVKCAEMCLLAVLNGEEPFLAMTKPFSWNYTNN